MTLAAAALTAAALMACSTQSQRLAANEQGCMASCNKPSADGESCLSWAALTSERCVTRHAPVGACCGAGDRPLCTLGHALVVGAACVCRDADARGAFVVQGFACTATNVGRAGG
jgi:hypothetical protein